MSCNFEIEEHDEEEIMEHLVCFYDGRPLFDEMYWAVLNSNSAAVRAIYDLKTGDLLGYLG